MHLCVSKLTIIGSDNGLSLGRRQAIIWTNVGILLIIPLGTNFSEILMEIYTFSFKKMHLIISSGKWQPYCLGLNVLTPVIHSILGDLGQCPCVIKLSAYMISTKWFKHLLVLAKGAFLKPVPVHVKGLYKIQTYIFMVFTSFNKLTLSTSQALVGYFEWCQLVHKIDLESLKARKTFQSVLCPLKACYVRCLCIYWTCTKSLKV